MTAHASEALLDHINCWRPSNADGLRLSFMKITFAAPPRTCYCSVLLILTAAISRAVNDLQPVSQAGQECKSSVWMECS